MLVSGKTNKGWGMSERDLRPPFAGIITCPHTQHPVAPSRSLRAPHGRSSLPLKLPSTSIHRAFAPSFDYSAGGCGTGIAYVRILVSPPSRFGLCILDARWIPRALPSCHFRRGKGKGGDYSGPQEGLAAPIKEPQAQPEPSLLRSLLETPTRPWETSEHRLIG